jgi:hypothetical protein
LIESASDVACFFCSYQHDSLIFPTLPIPLRDTPNSPQNSRFCDIFRMAVLLGGDDGYSHSAA